MWMMMLVWYVVLQAEASRTWLEWVVRGRGSWLLPLSWTTSHHWSHIRWSTSLQWQQEHRRCSEDYLLLPTLALVVHNDSGSRLAFYRSSSDGSIIVSLDSDDDDDDDDVGFCGFWVFWGFLFWNCHYCNRWMERFTTTRLSRNQWRSTTTIPTAIVKSLPIW